MDGLARAQGRGNVTSRAGGRKAAEAHRTGRLPRMTGFTVFRAPIGTLSRAPLPARPTSPAFGHVRRIRRVHCGRAGNDFQDRLTRTSSALTFPAYRVERSTSGVLGRASFPSLALPVRRSAPHWTAVPPRGAGRSAAGAIGQPLAARFATRSKYRRDAVMAIRACSLPPT
jgi:hypothetical protein